MAAGFVVVLRRGAETNGDDARDTGRRQVSSVQGPGGGEGRPVRGTHANKMERPTLT